MSFTITRRGLLGTAAAASMLARPSLAANRTLNVLCHRVHQACLTAGAAGDQLGDWRSANGADIAWTTLDTDPLQDRLFREASLDKTISAWATSSTAAPPATGQTAAAAERLPVRIADRGNLADIAPGLARR